MRYFKIFNDIPSTHVDSKIIVITLMLLLTNCSTKNRLSLPDDVIGNKNRILDPVVPPLLYFEGWSQPQIDSLDRQGYVSVDFILDKRGIIHKYEIKSFVLSINGEIYRYDGPLKVKKRKTNYTDSTNTHSCINNNTIKTSQPYINKSDKVNRIKIDIEKALPTCKFRMNEHINETYIKAYYKKRHKNYIYGYTLPIMPKQGEKGKQKFHKLQLDSLNHRGDGDVSDSFD